MPEADVERCLLETVETSVTLYRGQLVNRDGRQAADLIATLRRQVEELTAALAVNEGVGRNLHGCLRDAEARLSEVEAERDRLAAVLGNVVAKAELGAKLTESKGASEGFTVIADYARATLSPEEPRPTPDSGRAG